MKLAILHLSDIHFEHENDWIYNEANSIAKTAVASVFGEKLDAFVIIISGDIANNGLASEYELAFIFLSTIKEYIVQELQISTHFIVVPGNHDCDLSDEKKLKLRTIAINSIINDPNVATPGDEIYEKCMEVQTNFFNFVRNLEPDLSYPAKPEVYWQLNITVGNEKIVFNCFNTAWLTQVKETQGLLLIPTEINNQASQQSDDSSLAITVYHHPENWLDADNSIQFRPLLIKISDIVITGHEHDKNILNQKQLETGEEIQIHRAAALQERSNSNKSSFNVILLDVSKKEQQLISFEWKNSEFTSKSKTDWISFARNKYLTKGKFQLNPDFESFLNNLDTIPITHARRQHLQVTDLFVLPRLQVYSLEDIIDGKDGSKLILRKIFVNFLFSEKKVLLYGDTLQGKTTIAKFAFLKSRERSLFSIFVNGRDLSSPKPKEVAKVLKAAFQKQYNSTTWEDLLRLEKSRRMVIIDDFGSSGLNQAELQEILTNISQEFDYVLAVAHINLHLQQYIENEEGKILFSEYTHCELRPMNRNQRTELITKWTKLGRTSTTEDFLVKQINQKQQIIENCVDTCMVPPYASYLLGVLQVSDSAIPSTDKTKYGTVGFLYNSLITNRFENLSDDIDIAQTFLLLGQIAYVSYKSDTLEISKDLIDEILREYLRLYRQPIALSTFINQAVGAGIVLERNNKLQFASVQLRDFFVADYYSVLLGTGTEEQILVAHEEIDLIIKTLIYETHTRILLFLVFKAYDKPRFIQQVLNVSRIIYQGFKPANFEEDVDFLNQLKNDLPKPNLLTKGSVLDRREMYDRQLDDYEERNGLVEYKDKNKYLVEYREDLDQFIKSSIALKMIEVLGQLLRSFASTLKGNIQVDLIQECINLGLRFLEAMFQIREEDIQDVRNVLIQLIEKKHSELKDVDLIGRADHLLLFIFQNLSFGVLKKISSSVGDEKLKTIYSDLFYNKELPLSYRMVETTLHLDHYDDPRINNILKLSEKLKEDNKFVWEVLRLLVANKLNFSSGLTAKNRQQLAKEFEFGDNQSWLLNPEKTEQKYLPSSRKSFVPPEFVNKTSKSKIIKESKIKKR